MGGYLSQKADDALRVDSSEVTKYRGGSDFEKRRRAKMRMKKPRATPWTIHEFQRREMR
jgi:hypothetical protein